MIQEFDAQSSERPELQFSRDSQTLLGAQMSTPRLSESQATAWDLSKQKVDWSDAIPDYMGIDNRFKFSSDGRRLGLLHFDTLKVLDISQGGKYPPHAPTLMRVQLLFKKSERSGRFSRRLALSSGGDVAVVCDQNVRLQFWDVASSKIIGQTPPPPQFMRAIGDIVVSPDARYVALSDSGTLALWDRTKAKWTQLQLSGVALRFLAWMPDSRSLWMSDDFSPGNAEDETRQLSVPDLKTLRTLSTAGPVAVSGDGKTLATRADTTQKGIWLWNLD